MARTKSGAGYLSACQLRCDTCRWSRSKTPSRAATVRERLLLRTPRRSHASFRPAAICWLLACLAFGQAAISLLAAQDQTNPSNSAAETLNTEPDPSRRAERAVSLAEGAFSEARVEYDKNQIKAGDQHLDEMIKLLNVCVSSLEAAHKSHNYKPAEIRVKGLMRRMKTLIGDLSVDDRGWAEYTARQLEGIHDKLLSGAMKK